MSEIIRASVDSIKSSFDANTVTGDPIATANGTVIIPVSKLQIGFATGGIDYLGKNSKDRPAGAEVNNFGGGGGTGLTVTPIAFIIIQPDGTAQLVNVNEPYIPKDPVSQIIGAIERSPELIENFRSVFSKNKADDTEE